MEKLEEYKCQISELLMQVQEYLNISDLKINKFLGYKNNKHFIEIIRNTEEIFDISLVNIYP